MYKVKSGNRVFEIEKKGEEFFVDGTQIKWDIIRTGENQFHVLYKNQSFNVEVIEMMKEEKKVRLMMNNKEIELQVEDRFDQLLHQLGMDKTTSSKANNLKAPMPGMVLKVLVDVGVEVNAGDSVLVLEAMKMENVLKSAGAGKVKAVKVKAGDKVEKNQVMIEME